jgi:hypothetical protein
VEKIKESNTDNGPSGTEKITRSNSDINGNLCFDDAEYINETDEDEDVTPSSSMPTMQTNFRVT